MKGQGEDYNKDIFLDFEHIKNHYKSIVVDLRTKK